MQPNILNRLRHIAVFVFRTRWWLLVLFALVIVILVADWFGHEWIQEKREELWSKVLEHYIAFGTFLVAFAAWFGNATRDWKEALPKRLSVYYVHENKIIMQCNYAYLSGEADIRQMGQQIGAQISKDRNLSFSAADVVWKEAPIVYSRDQSKHCPSAFTDDQYPFRHYVVLYRLSTRPESLENNTCYIWEPPFVEEAKASGKLQYSEAVAFDEGNTFDPTAFWEKVKTAEYCTYKHFLKRDKE